MLKYILRRFCSAVLSLFIIVTVMFCLLRMMPLEGYLGANVDKMSPEVIAAKLAAKGLDKPLHIQLINFNLRGEIIGIEQGSIVFELLVHMQVVERKVAVALVAVGHIGGYHIGVSRAQGHHLAGQGNLCFAIGHQKQACEGRRYSLPFPIGVVACKSHIEHNQTQRFYRYIHGRWVSDYATKVGIFL